MNELVSLNDSQDFSELIKKGSEQDLQKFLGSDDFTAESKLARLHICTTCGTMKKINLAAALSSVRAWETLSMILVVVRNVGE